MQNDNEEAEDDDLEGQTLIPVLTNEVTQFKLDILKAIYNSVVSGQLGYLDAKDPETGEIVPLLVGIEYSDKGTFKPYPIAKFITGKDVFKNYLVPDGRGNYCSGDDEEESRSSEGIDKEKSN